MIEHSYKEFDCGCLQHIHTITIESPLKRKIQVRSWASVCESCHNSGKHSFDRQPQAKWIS